jgi:hypothetical protein
MLTERRKLVAENCLTLLNLQGNIVDRTPWRDEDAVLYARLHLGAEGGSPESWTTVLACIAFDLETANPVSACLKKDGEVVSALDDTAIDACRLKLPAVFQAQQWVHDDAIDSASARVFDAGMTVLSLSVVQLLYVRNQVHKEFGGDLDLVAEKAGLVGNERHQHHGPYSVRIDKDELDQFLASVGIKDHWLLTPEDLQAARERLMPHLAGERKRQPRIVAMGEELLKHPAFAGNLTSALSWATRLYEAAEKSGPGLIPAEIGVPAAASSMIEESGPTP